MEFDVNFVGSYLAVSFGGKDDTNLMNGYGSVAFIDSWTFLKPENIDGIESLPITGEENALLRTPISGKGEKHVVIALDNGKLSVTVGGETYWTDYNVAGWLDIGYVGIFAQENTSAYIRNLKVTNGVSGASKTYFVVTGDAGDDPVLNGPTIQDWTVVGAEEALYQIGDKGVLYFDNLDSTHSQLILNSGLYGKDNPNYLNFDPATMTDYTIEYDMSINEVVSGRGYLSFTVLGDNHAHLGNNGVVMVFNSDVSTFKYEIPAVKNDETPIGFWTDVASQVRTELKPPASGFFAPTPNAPIQARLQGNQLMLVCANSFTMGMINKPEILELVSRKASAKLGRPIRVSLVDQSTGKGNSEQMEQLLRFGRAHSDIINIKE
jgi:hypothetical protein